MERSDVLVIGAGISGLAFAAEAVRRGRKVRVLERESQVGGCLASRRSADGCWFELGAHTTYNSYGGFLDLAAQAGVLPALLPRGPARARFGLLRGEDCRWLTPPKILLELDWLEAAPRALFALLAGKRGLTMREYHARLLGPGNYARVLAPFLAAVPSQPADDFPAEGPGSLFKKRPRRKEFPRSYGFDGGLGVVPEGLARLPGIEVMRGAGVESLQREGGQFVAITGDGQRHTAPVAVLAASIDETTRLARSSFPRLATSLGGIASIRIDSVGVVLPSGRVRLPEVAFIAAADDVFHSVVTRDPFPDPARRAFTFHFRAGLTSSQRLARIAKLLAVPESDLGEAMTWSHVLPSPRLGHGERIAAIDSALAGSKLAVVGNAFEGMAIEDCINRARAEAARVLG
jgi:protoporphyrinogen/coproporphyrinogen III oxidase